MPDVCPSSFVGDTGDLGGAEESMKRAHAGLSGLWRGLHLILRCMFKQKPASQATGMKILIVEGWGKKGIQL